MYFEKHVSIELFFYIAHNQYKRLSEGSRPELSDKIERWQGVIPDEAAFSIATYITGNGPEIKDWQPILDSWSYNIGGFNVVTGPVAMIGKYGITLQGDPHSDSTGFYDYVCMLLKIKYQINDLFKWEKK
jgi:hypothetical protein